MKNKYSLSTTKLNLRESNYMQTNIIARIPGYVYCKNTKMEYMGCNNNLARISGLSDSTEIIGKTDYDFEWGREHAD